MFSVADVFMNTRMDKDNSMTVDWGEFLHHVILNPVDNIGELVSSWKHSLVRAYGHVALTTQHFSEAEVCINYEAWTVHFSVSNDTVINVSWHLHVEDKCDCWPCRFLMWVRVVRCPSSSPSRRPVLVRGGRLLSQQDWLMQSPEVWRRPSTALRPNSRSAPLSGATTSADWTYFHPFTPPSILSFIHTQ